jgi:hypothetical protein
MRKCLYPAALLAALCLLACSPPIAHPAFTADQILAAQYGAGSGHGMMSGEEAAQITDAYRRDIGSPLPNDDAAMAGSGPKPTPSAQ